MQGHNQLLTILIKILMNDLPALHVTTFLLIFKILKRDNLSSGRAREEVKKENHQNLAPEIILYFY